MNRPSPSSAARENHGPASHLATAELCLQRLDFMGARSILRKRLDQGADDFKTWNLLGVCWAQMGDYGRAVEVFRRFSERKNAKTVRHKAMFNRGLALFFRDLEQVGDCSVARTMGPRAMPTTVQPDQLPRDPFTEAVSIWQELLRLRTHSKDIFFAHLSFAFLQRGDLDRALDCMMSALSMSEHFYLTQYILGRLFLDLFYLSAEGSHYPINRTVAEFFEVEEFEIMFKEGDRCAVQRETHLDIAMQAFLEARRQNPMSLESTLGLSHTYLLAGMLEEAYESLAHAEALAPDSLQTLEMALVLHQRSAAPPETIRTLVNRIREQRRLTPRQPVTNILPAHYLL
ncbi:hypothetical protein SCOR_13640 [Sulfidibacter corallicola]|uniref:Tetratricopeptide repeat protein n=1 Tax=Sulfidibacter corallicola TaxID=2818388 RepID=A0A8A4TDJ8_SULCO|nr:hypothetical protein [Sulfidibacter corallicola]QTD47640.1 hypothetical protein J3U87_18770 [Sulfidibacter corallicola]